MKGAYLKLVIGCMYSGKSSYLLSEINRYKNICKFDSDILTVNSILDKQRHYSDNIKSHDNFVFKAHMVNTLNELNDISEYKDAKIILIDESQFYSDLYEFLNKELKNTTKIFIVAGLSNDSNMNSFGDITKLIPLADDIIKLSALCVKCNDFTSASFTKYLDNSSIKDSQILIGAKDLYIPVCRFHYYEK